MTTRILGIDPGTRVTGYGVVECGAQNTLIECGVIRTKTDDPLPDRLLSLDEGLEREWAWVQERYGS